MRRKLLALASGATALVMLGSQPALALPTFPGAGYGVKNVARMTTEFKVPTLTCLSGENSVVVLGLISPATGTLDGWNAAAVTGCYLGRQWTRIQVWVNA